MSTCSLLDPGHLNLCFPIHPPGQKKKYKMPKIAKHQAINCLKTTNYWSGNVQNVSKCTTQKVIAFSETHQRRI